MLASLAAVSADLAPDGEEDPAGEGPGCLLHYIAQVAAHADLTGLPEPPRPLVDISVKLMLAAVSASGAIAQVHVDQNWLLVRRGPDELDVDSFRLDGLVTDHFTYLPAP